MYLKVFCDRETEEIGNNVYTCMSSITSLSVWKNLMRKKTTISDLVQIAPEDFQKPSAEAIEDNINAKYANKVYPLRN